MSDAITLQSSSEIVQSRSFILIFCPARLLIVSPGALHVPLLLRLHRGDQQLPGPGGVRVRQREQQDLPGGERRHLHVSGYTLSTEALTTTNIINLQMGTIRILIILTLHQPDGF